MHLLQARQNADNRAQAFPGMEVACTGSTQATSTEDRAPLTLYSAKASWSSLMCGTAPSRSSGMPTFAENTEATHVIESLLSIAWYTT